MTKAILFDLDGTLLETHRHSCRAAHRTLRALGLPDVPDELVMRHIGEPADVFLRAIAPGIPTLPLLRHCLTKTNGCAEKRR